MTLLDALLTVGDPTANPMARNEAVGVLLEELAALARKNWGADLGIADDATQTIVMRLWTKPHRIHASSEGQARAFLRTSLHRQMLDELAKRGRAVSYDEQTHEAATGGLGADVELDARRASAEDLETVVDAALAKTRDPAKWWKLLVEIRTLSTEGVRLIDVVRDEQAELGEASDDQTLAAEQRRRQNHTRARKYVHKHLDGYPDETDAERERVEDLRRRFDDVYRFNKRPKKKKT